MKAEIAIFFFCLFAYVSGNLLAQEMVQVKGQASVWANYHDYSNRSLWVGGRYLPQLNVRLGPTNRGFDGEASAHLSTSLGIEPFVSTRSEEKAKCYRLWLRYASNQLEIRLGLQKINFGSATLLRPLMWFDQVDPRDPLQLTDGVWALLGRYYFLNNANVWLWLVQPAKELKSWELIKSSQHHPELGARVQWPLRQGEAGLSGHLRVADAGSLADPNLTRGEVWERRIGLDAKWDWLVGLWFEASWHHLSKPLGLYSNQTCLTLGTDYTFAIGNGLNTLFEHLWFSQTEKALDLTRSHSFSGFSLSYPISAFDHLSAIFYYNWSGEGFYKFINWRRQYKHFDLLLLAFWNPTAFLLLQQATNDAANLFSGKGVQMMLVYYH